MLTISDLDKQSFCLKRNDLLFPLKQNKFLHNACNPIIVDKLKKIKFDQVKSFTEQINIIIKTWKKMEYILEAEKLLTCLNILYSLSGCENKLEDFLLCSVCNKMVNIVYIKKHKEICKINNCQFFHVDGRPCEKINHNKTLHRYFFQSNDINKKRMYINVEKFQKNFNYKEMFKTNEIIAYKSKHIFQNLNLIVKEFQNNFDIYSKKCLCFLRSKNCQCFRYVLNNIDIVSFKKRKTKNVYEALKDIKNCKRNVIAVITAEKENGFIKHKKFSFFSTFRKNDFLKLIILHNLEIQL